jgi:hypothetical protein
MEATLELLPNGAMPFPPSPAADAGYLGPPLVSGPPVVLEGVLPESRLRQVKFSYTARSAFRHPLGGLLVGDLQPRAGDLVLARVVAPGQHTRLELRTGRRAHLFRGDEIVVSYGNRYAPDQFEAELPPDLAPCHLVAAGGIASLMRSCHTRMGEPTTIAPVGLLVDSDGSPLNLERWALGPSPQVEERPLTLAVVGSTMNSGKTTTAANLVKGLVRAGRRVGAAKVTGTGAGGDVWFLNDSGANPVLDFTAMGLASTYLAGDAAVERCFTSLHDHLAAAAVETIVLEVADGVYQQETSFLLGSAAFAERVDGVLFAASDALGTSGAVAHMQDLDIPLIAISGVITSSPLASREARKACGLPVVETELLSDPSEVVELIRERGQALAV